MHSFGPSWAPCDCKTLSMNECNWLQIWMYRHVLQPFFQQGLPFAQSRVVQLCTCTAVECIASFTEQLSVDAPSMSWDI